MPGAGSKLAFNNNGTSNFRYLLKIFSQIHTTIKMRDLFAITIINLCFAFRFPERLTDHPFFFTDSIAV